MKLRRICYATSFLKESAIFPDGKRERMRPIDFAVFMIEDHNRCILVDAGCETMPGFEMKDFVCPAQLIDPLAVTDLIITHAHHDHIEAVKYFKNATVYIQREEYQKGKRYIPAELSVVLFDEEYRLTEQIRMVKIGGHSPGSSVVEVQIDGKCYVFSGDECYSYENLNKKIPTGSSYDPAKSKAFIEKYSQDPYICLLCHEKREQ